MVNRQGSSAGKPVQFEGNAEIGRKMPDVPVDSGAGFAALTKLFDAVGTGIGAMADDAAKREGTLAGLADGKAAFDNMKPLALRRDGTIRGDAADQAAASAVEWRTVAELHKGVVQAHLDTKGDLAAFDARVAKLTADLGARTAGDPVLSELLARKMETAVEPYRRAVMTEQSSRAEEERRGAADEAMAATEVDLARKAFLAGADPKSGQAIETDVGQAKAAIDAAVADGVITGAEGTRRKKRLADGVVEARLRGVFDALPDVASKTAWADGLERRWAAGDPALAGMDQSRVQGLMAHMRGQARSDEADRRLQTALDRHVLEKQLGDDVASIRATGLPTEGADQRDEERLTQLLGPVDAAKWVAERRAAEAWWAEAGDLGRLSNDEIARRLGAIDVAPGSADYEAKAKLRQDMAKEADRILKLRATDPARAVDDTVKAARDAKAALDPSKPETFQRWVSVRLSTQAALGIPPGARQPLTSAEALALAAPLTRAAPGQEFNAFKALSADLSKRYGQFAPDVARQILMVQNVDDDTARAGITFMDKLRRGDPAALAASRVDLAREAGAADKAMAPPAPTVLRQPITGADIDMLQTHPNLAGAFDEKFGTGTAQFYLAQPKRQKAPGTTTRAPDGTEGWQP